MKLRVVFVLLSLLIATSGFAFGPEGHRIVCQIALLELDAADQDEAIRLARAFRRPDGGSEELLRDGCIFADEARGRAQDGVPGWDRFNEFENWHFLNVPRTTRVADADECDDDCVLEGMRFHSAQLLSGPTDRERGEGLLFLVHWVADAHQPLHISFRDDRGGGLIPLSSNSRYSGHLHRVWDSGIIQAAMRAAQVSDPLVFARRLRNAITSAERTQWLQAGREQWLQESYDITLQPDVQYCRFVTQSRCRPIGGPRTLTSSYQNLFQDDVELRLKQAGVRLASEIRAALHP